LSVGLSGAFGVAFGVASGVVVVGGVAGLVVVVVVVHAVSAAFSAFSAFSAASADAARSPPKMHWKNDNINQPPNNVGMKCRRTNKKKRKNGAAATYATFHDLEACKKLFHAFFADSNDNAFHSLVHAVMSCVR